MSQPKRPRKATPAMHGAPIPTAVRLRWDLYPQALDAIRAVFRGEADEFMQQLVDWARQKVPGAVAHSLYSKALTVGIARMKRVHDLANALDDELSNLGTREWRAMMDAEAELFPEELKMERPKVALPTKDGPRIFELSPPEFSPISNGTHSMIQRLRKLRDTAADASARLKQSKAKRGPGRSRTPEPLVEVAREIAELMKASGTNPSGAADGPFVAILEVVADFAKQQSLVGGTSARTLAELALREKGAEINQ
jgi:hypothetical protein